MLYFRRIWNIFAQMFYFAVGFSNVNNVAGDKFFHLVVCLTTGSKPVAKRALHVVRSRASSFK